MDSEQDIIDKFNMDLDTFTKLFDMVGEMISKKDMNTYIQVKAQCREFKAMPPHIEFMTDYLLQGGQQKASVFMYGLLGQIERVQFDDWTLEHFPGYKKMIENRNAPISTNELKDSIKDKMKF